jgi:hypothetical protein
MMAWPEPLEISIPKNANNVRKACGEESEEKVRLDSISALPPNFQVV